ncbi:MAG: hypothetical protein VKI81_12505, partial [Synechococcaceae cyanobacterium]|nr:hypothetical protein [Synechococcaceae cyanobacterium]
GRCERREEYFIPAERSVGLAVIEAGVSAYLAPLGPNHGAQAAIERAIACETGIPLGDVMRRSYHDVVMDTEGHPERIGLFVAGGPVHGSPDGFVNFNGPQNRALYGDPLLRPFGDHRSPATVEVSAKEHARGIEVTFRVAGSGYLGRTLYGNRDNPGRGRIYEVVPLKGHPVTVTLDGVEARSEGGTPYAITRRAALLERIDGQTLLHVQLVTDDPKALSTRGSLVRARLTFGSGAPGPRAGR